MWSSEYKHMTLLFLLFELFCTTMIANGIIGIAVVCHPSRVPCLTRLQAVSWVNLIMRLATHDVSLLELPGLMDRIP